jgi:choice-of-anchor A domain-containing protein
VNFFVAGGPAIPTALNGAEAAAKAASNAAWALPGTDIGSIKAKKDGTFELTGAAGCNVYKVKDIDLKKATMTLHGTANSFFIFNVSGDVKIFETKLVLDGVLHNHVLWNTGPTNKKSVDIKWSQWAGTWVTQVATFSLLRTSLDGAVFAGASSKCRWSQVSCTETH